MLESGQLDQNVLRANALSILQTAVCRDWDECTVVNLPTVADFSIDRSHQFQFGPISDPDWSNDLILWSPSMGEALPDPGVMFGNRAVVPTVTIASGGTLLPAKGTSAPFIEPFPVNDGSPNQIYIQPTMRCSISPDGELRYETVEEGPYFDFSCNVVASAEASIRHYFSEARESWKRYLRQNIFSSAASKNGHLSFLVPRYRRVCVETAARDHVVHLEVITLAEEQEAPSTLAVGQMLILGGISWKNWKSRLSNLLSRFLQKTRPSGSWACGLNFANVERRLLY